MSISWMDNKSYGFQPHLIRNCCPNVSARFETFKVTCRSSLAMETFCHTILCIFYCTPTDQQPGHMIISKIKPSNLAIDKTLQIMKMKRDSGC